MNMVGLMKISSIVHLEDQMDKNMENEMHTN